MIVIVIECITEQPFAIADIKPVFLIKKQGIDSNIFCFELLIERFELFSVKCEDPFVSR